MELNYNNSNLKVASTLIKFLKPTCEFFSKNYIKIDLAIINNLYTKDN